MISYEKMLKLFEEHNVTSYTVKKEKLMGQATWKKIHEGGHIDTRTLEAVCQYFHCQLGDVIEYIPDEPKEQPQIDGQLTLDL